MPQDTCELMPGGPDPEECKRYAVLQMARRRGYEDGLVAVGVPYVEAVRRAAERYP